MRWRVFLAAAVSLASCGEGQESAESKATNATLFDQATVDAVLGANVKKAELTVATNENEGPAENEADVPVNAAD